MADDVIRKREKELQEKEAELMRRERELKVQEDRSKPNFPREFFCIKPIVHHDIDADIPPARAGFMRMFLWGYYAQVLVLVYNVVTSIAAISSPDKENVKSPIGGFSTHMGVSIVHLLGIPGAFILWYWTTYKAVGKSTQYYQSLLGIGVGFFYNLFMTLGISGYGASGFLFALQVQDEKDGGVAFALILINSLAWLCMVLFFVWGFKKVYRYQNEDKATSIAAALASGAI
eukprot:PhF_6_TR41625/c0_g1_i1/m.63089/K19995/SCAMP; secretory carrier-associated membrane protein